MSLEKYLAKKSGKGFRSGEADQPKKGFKKSAAAADKMAGKESSAATKGGSGDSLEDEFKKSSKNKRPYMNGCD